MVATRRGKHTSASPVRSRPAATSKSATKKTASTASKRQSPTSAVPAPPSSKAKARGRSSSTKRAASPRKGKSRVRSMGKGEGDESGGGGGAGEKRDEGEPGVSRSPSRTRKGVAAGKGKRPALGHDPDRPFYTLSYDEAPDYLRHNHFVRTHYRYQSTAWQCVKSMVRLHNQTTNIHTHLFAFLFFATLLHGAYTRVDWARDPYDAVLLFIEVVAQMVLFFCSFTFHTFDAHSSASYKFFVKLDYAGIVLAFSMSLCAFSYHAFSTEPDTQWGYCVFFAAIGIPVTVAVLSEKMATPKYRAIRAALFGVTIGSGLIAVTHFAWREVISHHWESGARELMWPVLRLCLTSYVLQVILVTVYVTRVPERWWQCEFVDVWFHSHMIVHLLCFASTYVWHLAVYAIRDVRLEQLATRASDIAAAAAAAAATVTTQA